MKRFSQTVVQIKNADGDFEPIAALRGMSSYECAVQNGFEGTEDDWLEMMLGDGWVGKFQELEAKKANKTDVYTHKQVDELLVGFDKDAQESAVSAAALSSYLALVGHTNTDMINAALGMNNENDVLGVGKALAMYAKFKDPSIDIDAAFPELVKYNSLNELSTEAVIEMINNTTLHEMVFYDANTYMFAKTILEPAKNVVYSQNVDYPDGTIPIQFDCLTLDSSNITTKDGGGFGGLAIVTKSYPSGDGYGVFKSVESIPTNGAKFLNIYIEHIIDYMVAQGTGKFGIVDSDGTTFTKYVPLTASDRWYSIDISDLNLDEMVIGFYLNPASSYEAYVVGFDHIILSDFEIK